MYVCVHEGGGAYRGRGIKREGGLTWVDVVARNPGINILLRALIPTELSAPVHMSLNSF